MLVIIGEDRVTLAHSGALHIRDADVDGNEPGVDDARIWDVPNEDGLIIGVGDDRVIADLLRYDADLVRGTLSLQKIQKEVIPAIRKKLGQFGKIAEKGFTGNSIYIAQGNRCFEIDSMFTCTEVERMSGYQIIEDDVVSYCECHADMPMEERLKKAFRYSEDRLGRKMFPVLWMDTKERKVRKIEKEN